MKKLLLSIVGVLVFGLSNAQETKFGVTAGVDFATATLKIPGYSTTESSTAYYIGGLVNIGVSEEFEIQPEILYVFNKDGKQLQLPILAKYFVAEKFSIMAGPDFLFDLGEKTQGIKTFGYGVDLGLGYDIDENFGIETRYNLGLSNYIENGSSDMSLKTSGLFIGATYKF